MNTGVSTFPCESSKLPPRAAPSVALTVNFIELASKSHLPLPLGRGRGGDDQNRPLGVLFRRLPHFFRQAASSNVGASASLAGSPLIAPGRFGSWLNLSRRFRGAVRARIGRLLIGAWSRRVDARGHPWRYSAAHSIGAGRR